MQPMVRGSKEVFLEEVTCKEGERGRSKGGSSRGNSMCKASELKRSISHLLPGLAFLTRLLEWGSAASWPCTSSKEDLEELWTGRC